LFALHMLPIRISAASLIILGFAFFILEAKYQAHGALGIGGVISMVIGALLLVDAPIPEMRINLKTAAGVALPLAAITIFLTTIAIQARRNKVTTGKEGLIGMVGVTRSALTPDGKVFVDGEIWNAKAATPIEAGQKIRVREIDG